MSPALSSVNCASWPQVPLLLYLSCCVFPGESPRDLASGSSPEDVFSAVIFRLLAKANGFCDEFGDVDVDPSPVLDESELSGIPLVYFWRICRCFLTRTAFPWLSSRHRSLASVSISFLDSASSRPSTGP